MTSTLSDTIGQSPARIKEDVKYHNPPGYIPGLDGIRAICVSVVMIAHAGFQNIVPGGLGVTAFFFLSGYLITTLLIDEKKKNGQISLKDFYIRRVLRLSPELFLLMAYGIIMGFIYNKPSIVDIVSAITYTSNYTILYTESFTGDSARWPHLWSLAVEEHFYLTFPILMIFASGRLKTLACVMVAVCITCLLWRIYIVADGAPFGFLQSGRHPYTYIASDTRADSIAYGCLTAVMFKLFPQSITGRAVGFAILAISAALLLSSLIIRNPDFRESWRYSLQGISMSLFFVVLFRTVWGPSIINILEMPFLKIMGILSYGAYLWHLEAISLSLLLLDIDRDQATMLNKLAIVVLCFAVTFIAARFSLIATAPVRRLRAKFHRTKNVS